MLTSEDKTEAKVYNIAFSYDILGYSDNPEKYMETKKIM